MRPLLYIGLGGTGGKVLGVIQHEMTTRLRAAGRPTLPEAWQFLHIDVPAHRDAHEAGQPFALRERDYFPLTDGASTYTNSHRRVRAALGGAMVADCVDCWAPIPGDVTDNVAAGAMQIRSVGRMVGLAKLPELAEELRTRVTAAKNGGGLREAATAMRLAPPDLTAGLQVVVVGSISGGSGSGLTLDVLDLLNSLGVARPLTALFTPEVFESATADGGVAPNTFAAAMELVSAAMQGNNAPHTTREGLFLSANVTPSTVTAGAEGYWLVGKSSQTGPSFANHNEVYRVVGKTFAELAFDESLMNNLSSYVLTNLPARKRDVEDLTGMSQPGWNAQPNLLGLGFAQLSVGREFFGAYAEQRLLRLCVEQLLEAHLDVPESEKHKSNEQLLADATTKHYPAFVRDAHLSELDRKDGRNDDILNALTIRDDEPHRARMADFFRAAQDAVLERERRLVGLGMGRISMADAAEVLHQHVHGAVTGGVSAHAGTYQGDIRGQASTDLVRKLEDYENGIQRHLAQIIPELCALRGLPVVARMLERLVGELKEASKQLTQQSEATLGRAQSNLTMMRSPDVSAPKSFGKNDLETLESVVGTAAGVVQSFVEADELKAVSGLVSDLAVNMVRPWADGVASALRMLQDHALQPIDKVKPIDALPGPGAVPAHLRPSPVEFLLEDIDQFPGILEDQILLRLPQEGDMQLARASLRREAVDAAVVDIISGFRDALVGDHVTRQAWTEPVGVYLSTWVSRARDAMEQRTAQVYLRLTWHDLVDRVHEWLYDPDERTRTFLECTLEDYLLPSEDAVQPAVIKARHDRMVGQFSSMLRVAQPLVRLNTSLLSQLHGVNTVESKLVLGTVSVPVLTPEQLRRFGVEQLTERLSAVALRQAGGDVVIDFGGAPSNRVTVFSSSDKPFHPVVAASLMDTVVQTQGSDSSIAWHQRRTRPVGEMIPLAPPAQVALVRGLLASRMLGQAEYRSQTRQLRVRDGVMWVDVAMKGLRPVHPREGSFDLIGRFMEGYLLTLMEVYRRTSLSALRGYQRVFDIGVAALGADSPLTDWVQRGGMLPHTEDPFLLVEAESEAERREQILEALGEFRINLEKLEQVPARDLVERQRHTGVMGRGEDIVTRQQLVTLELARMVRLALDELETSLPSPAARRA